MALFTGISLRTYSFLSRIAPWAAKFPSWFNKWYSRTDSINGSFLNSYLYNFLLIILLKHFSKTLLNGPLVAVSLFISNWGYLMTFSSCGWTHILSFTFASLFWRLFLNVQFVRLNRLGHSFRTLWCSLSAVSKTRRKRVFWVIRGWLKSQTYDWGDYTLSIGVLYDIYYNNRHSGLINCLKMSRYIRAL